MSRASVSTGTPDGADQPDLRTQAIRILTEAVRAGAAEVPTEQDFAGFLSSVLASVAANVGSVDLVLAARPGSWEADLVRQLIEGTVGPEGEYLLQHRTEPVIVPLHVHRLVFDRSPDYKAPFDEELAQVCQRHASLPDGQYDPDAEDADIERITTFWAAQYAAFAQAFTAAVHAEAALIEGLTAPVSVTAITDPEAGFDDCPADPYEFDGNPLVWRLWDAAVNAVPLPARSKEQSS